MTTATQTRYRIESRIPGQTPWEPEGSGDTFDTEAAASAAIETLESTNDDGEPVEYRVVEAEVEVEEHYDQLDADDEADADADDQADALRAYAHWLLQAWCDGSLDFEDVDEMVVVGGERPGTVRWLDDCAGTAVVHCHGHCDPIAVYEAACPDGSDLDELTAEQIMSGPEAGAWLVW